MQFWPSYSLAGVSPVPLDMGYLLKASPALCSSCTSASQPPLQPLSSCWGFSALGCEESPHSCSNAYPLVGVSLPLDVGYLLIVAQVPLRNSYLCEVKLLSRVWLFPTPWTIYSLPGSSIHRIFKARILEWVAISFSRRSSQPKAWTQVSLIYVVCVSCSVMSGSLQPHGLYTSRLLCP